MALEAPQQGLVQNVWAIRGRDDHDAFHGTEAVHLGQQLRQSGAPVSFQAPAGLPTSTTTDVVELVDENDRWRVPARDAEQLLYLRRAHARIGPIEVRACRGDERRRRCGGHGSREERLAVAGRPREQQSLRAPRSETDEPDRRRQALHDLQGLGLRRADARDLVQGHVRHLRDRGPGGEEPVRQHAGHEGLAEEALDEQRGSRHLLT
mmetsp:Transcript_87295/g.252076  ORF Transcript_87295/g.252076 Transcript_87295/m.252076 type:complete len:208 (-) Transcript_87295:637-1260(-)